ncbi:hypothetical protein TNCV_622431 [Trichonephila clavipes]|nr:hypothetical protein TNCV_622431 [Trichonephila clavipes]
MDLSLPASTHSSRPLTPQEYASPTKQVTNCSKLQFLATNINLLAAEVESIKKLIQSIFWITDTPRTPSWMKRLKTCSEQHQQAISEFSSHLPCDIPGCTIHSTPHPTPVKESILEFPPLPKINID